MRRLVLSVAVVLGLGMTQARAQVEQAAAVEAKQGIVGKIFDDLKESTCTVHEINRENLAAEREAFGVRHSQATEPNPGFARFRAANGFKGKMSVLAGNFKESCRENSERERERREQIRSHESYRTLLEQQRGKSVAADSRG